MAWDVRVIDGYVFGGQSLIIIHDEGVGASIVTGMTLKALEEGEILEKNMMQPREVKPFLQACLDAAWKYGLRPTGVEDSTNELTAVRYHLEDMRKLAKVT